MGGTRQWESKQRSKKELEVHINTRRGQTGDKQRGGELCNKDEHEHEKGY
jgi:polyisoprenoid-binding protein YceI